MNCDHVTDERANDLVNRVYNADKFDDAVDEFAETIAAKPPLAIQAIKRSMTIATQTGLEEGTECDWRQFKPLLSTEDHEKDARAFAEEEYEPTFEGQ